MACCDALQADDPAAAWRPKLQNADDLLQAAFATLQRWAYARLQTESTLGSAAVKRDDLARFFISTEVQERKIGSHVAALKVKCGAIALSLGVPLLSHMKIAWIRPLNRQLQRLLKWGDAFTKPCDLEAAVANDDRDEIVAIHLRFALVPDLTFAPQAWE